jgi:hypothetical protein
MAKLPNWKHELFCLNIATGLNHSNAYRLAFHSDAQPSTIWNQACELYGKVGHRVQELRAELSAASTDKHWIASKEELMSYLTRAVRTPISAIDEHSDLCQEVKTTTSPEGATTKQIKAVNKMGAVSQLATIAQYVQAPGSTQISLTQNNLTLNTPNLDTALDDLLNCGTVVDVDPVTLAETAHEMVMERLPMVDSANVLSPNVQKDSMDYGDGMGPRAAEKSLATDSPAAQQSGPVIDLDPVAQLAGLPITTDKNSCTKSKRRATSKRHE